MGIANGKRSFVPTNSLKKKIRINVEVLRRFIRRSLLKSKFQPAAILY